MNTDAAPPSFKTAEVIDFGARGTGRERRRGWLAAPQWAAIAASLVVGVFAGQLLYRDDDASPVAIEGGRLVAASELKNALETKMASTPSEEGARIGLTFRDAGGRICRSFTDPAASGLACREGGNWQLKGLFPSGEGQAGEYRMAAGTDPRLASLIDETMAGEPFDATQERTARDAGWR